MSPLDVEALLVVEQIGPALTGSQRLRDFHSTVTYSSSGVAMAGEYNRTVNTETGR